MYPKKPDVKKYFGTCFFCATKKKQRENLQIYYRWTKKERYSRMTSEYLETNSDFHRGHKGLGRNREQILLNRSWKCI